MFYIRLCSRAGGDFFTLEERVAEGPGVVLGSAERLQFRALFPRVGSGSIRTFRRPIFSIDFVLIKNIHININI